jgi:hypothetical protein
MVLLTLLYGALTDFITKDPKGIVLKVMMKP